MKPRVRQVLSLLLVLLLPAGAAHAKKRAGVTLPDQIQVDGKPLTLNGLGVREATVFNVNVYVAGLYVEQPSNDAEALLASRGPKRLVLVFVRDVGRGDMVDAFREGFEKNSANAEDLRPRIDQLLGWMTGMKEGDQMAFTYVPASGVWVEVDGQTKGVIPGDDFARAFFGIWLGPRPPNKGLKKGLLGR